MDALELSLELSVELEVEVPVLLSVEVTEALSVSLVESPLRVTLVRLRWGVTTGEVRPAGIEAAGS